MVCSPFLPLLKSLSAVLLPLLQQDLGALQFSQRPLWQRLAAWAPQIKGVLIPN